MASYDDDGFDEKPRSNRGATTGTAASARRGDNNGAVYNALLVLGVVLIFAAIVAAIFYVPASSGSRTSSGSGFEVASLLIGAVLSYIGYRKSPWTRKRPR